MGLKTFKTIINTFIVHFLFVGIVSAEWIGPTKIVIAKWGSDVNEIGFVKGSSIDYFPRENDIGISYKNEIYTYDEVNKRIYKYDRNGVLQKNNLKVGCFQVHPCGGILVFDNKLKYFYDEFEELVNTEQIKYLFHSVGEKGYWFLEEKIIKNKYHAIFHLYSMRGEYLGHFNKKDVPELSREIIRKDNKHYQSDYIQIKYEDDLVYKFEVKNIDKIPNVYFRDRYKSVYILETRTKPFWADYNVYRKNICDDDIAKLVMPEGNMKLYDSKEGVDVTSEYGQPIVSINGDIYCWKRTPDTYSILKWVWVDSLDSPHSLTITDSKAGLSLVWEKPNQDADKVKEYEIVRSTDVCGEFKAIGKTKKSVLSYVDKDVKEGETYYYKVRAIKDKGRSGYSNKAVGKL